MMGEVAEEGEDRSTVLTNPHFSGWDPRLTVHIVGILDTVLFIFRILTLPRLAALITR